jgi:hypothetical protein
MEKGLASQIVNSTLALGKEIGKLDSLISQIADERERQEYIHALGTILGCLTRDIVFRIAREYPDLDPDR